MLPWLEDHAARARGGMDADVLGDMLAAAGIDVPPEEDVDAYDTMMIELQDLVRRARQPEGGAVGPHEAPRKFSVRWYKHHAHDPVVAGCEVTVLQMCYFIVNLHREGGMTAASVDCLCKAFLYGHVMTMPKDNKMPRCVSCYPGCCVLRLPFVHCTYQPLWGFLAVFCLCIV